MRSILPLIALACMPAFCQDAGQKLNDNLRQRVTDILNSQAQVSGNAAAPRPLRMTVSLPAPQLCSIPLLSATAPGKPVPMPGLKPRNPTAIPRPQDRMSIVVPAPACPANFARTVAPVPAPAPATKP
jgi:hypothetical protein